MASSDSSVRAALARLYDLDLADDPGDVELYLALADATGGPILELAAGSGRVAVPLAAAGHQVVAVDRDPDMLARAAARWAATRKRGAGGELRLVEADITTLELDEPRRRFELVLIALNSLLLLDRNGEQRQALDAIARHLAPAGKAVIDIWLPAPEDLAIYDGRLVLDWIRDEAETGERVAKTTSARYEPAARVARVTSLFETWRQNEPSRRVTREDRISFLTATELTSLVESAGLRVETLAGDYEMGPFAGDSDRLVMVCRSGSG